MHYFWSMLGLYLIWLSQLNWNLWLQYFVCFAQFGPTRCRHNLSALNLSHTNTLCAPRVAALDRLTPAADSASPKTWRDECVSIQSKSEENWCVLSFVSIRGRTSTLTQAFRPHVSCTCSSIVLDLSSLAVQSILVSCSVRKRAVLLLTLLPPRCVQTKALLVRAHCARRTGAAVCLTAKACSSPGTWGPPTWSCPRSTMSLSDATLAAW